jgi:hypothetical protein
MKAIWWEKTVEYQFILETHRRHSGSLISPFDGNHEQAGDAALASPDNRWLLIEFKRDQSTLNSEKTKFYDYEKAHRDLSDHDHHHHLVYAELMENSQLELRFSTYFSRTASSSVDEVVLSGIPYEEFDSYVKQLVALKRGPPSGGGGMAPVHDCVIGVNAFGDVISTMTLAEFAGYAPSPDSARYLSHGERSM